MHFDDEKYTRLVFLKMTDSPGKKAQTIFNLEPVCRLTYAKGKIIKRIEYFYFPSFSKNEIRSYPIAKREFIHLDEIRRSSFPLHCSLRGNHTLRSENTYVRERIKQRNLLYSGRVRGTWPRNYPRMCPLLHGVPSLSFKAESRKKKKKKKKLVFHA